MPLRRPAGEAKVPLPGRPLQALVRGHTEGGSAQQPYWPLPAAPASCLGCAAEARIPHLAFAYKEISQGAVGVPCHHRGLRTPKGLLWARDHGLLLSLTSVLLSLSHKHVLTAVDIREPCELPHLDDAAQRAREVEALAYAEPVEYLRHDILADDFLETLQQRVEEVGRPTAILAMHLCGRL
ncbi:unnamed protein product, partial [Effrenium voratum]